MSDISDLDQTMAKGRGPRRLPIAGPDTALLLDAAGTLLHSALPVAEAYAGFAAEHGCEVTAAVVRARFGEI